MCSRSVQYTIDSKGAKNLRIHGIRKKRAEYAQAQAAPPPPAAPAPKLGSLPDPPAGQIRGSFKDALDRRLERMDETPNPWRYAQGWWRNYQQNMEAIDRWEAEPGDPPKTEEDEDGPTSARGVAALDAGDAPTPADEASAPGRRSAAGADAAAQEQAPAPSIAVAGGAEPTPLPGPAQGEDDVALRIRARLLKFDKAETRRQQRRLGTPGLVDGHVCLSCVRNPVGPIFRICRFRSTVLHRSS